MWSRLSYTSLFEKVTETSATGPAVYGALVNVEGASGPVTIHAPNLTGPPAIAAKMSFDFGVVSDGAFAVTIDTLDGKTINGAATVVLPATPGAFALLFFDAINNDWVALVGGGGGGGGPAITSTTTSGIGFAVTTVDTVAVASPSIPVVAGQKVLVHFSCELDSDAAAAHSATFIARADGGAAIDTFRQTSTTVSSEVVSWTWESVGLAPGNHTFSVTVSADANGIFNLVTNALRITTVTLPG